MPTYPPYEKAEFQQSNNIFYKVFQDYKCPETLYMEWCGKYTFGYFYCRGGFLLLNPKYVRIWKFWPADETEEITHNVTYNYDKHEFHYKSDLNAIRFAEWKNLYNEYLKDSYCTRYFTKDELLNTLTNQTVMDWTNYCDEMLTFDKSNLENTIELLYDNDDERLFSFEIPIETIIEEIRLVQKLQEDNGVTLFWI